MLGWAGPLAAVLLGLILTARAWGSRPPAGDDVMAHLVRADFGLAHLVAHGRLDGWSPRFMLGHQEFLFYGQGFTWLLGLLRVASFGLLSTTGAMKVVSIGSVVLFPLAAAFLARSFGLSRRGAGLAAVLALAVDNIFGVGPAATFVVGLVPQQVAALLVCLGLGAGLRTLTDDRLRWPVLCAGSLAALAVTHLLSVPILAIFGVFAVLALLATYRPPRRRWARLVAAGTASLLLAAFWLVPFLAHGDLHGPVTTWATPPFGRRLGNILAGRELFGPRIGWIVALVGIGWATVMVVRRRPFAVALLAGPLVFLSGAHWAARHFHDNEVAVQLANRGLGFAGLIALLPVAAALGEAVVALRRRLPARSLFVADLAALAAAVALVTVVPGWSRSGADVARQMGEPVPDMRAAAAELGRVVPAGARFATERDYPAEISSTGVSHPDFWLARASGRPTLNIFNLESSSVHTIVFAPEQIGREPPVATADQLAKAGVTHVVTIRADTADALSASGRFDPVWRGASMAILRVLPATGHPEPSSQLSTAGPAVAELVHAEPEHLRVRVSSTSAGPATAAVAWSPKWHLHIDGRPAALGRDDDGLLRFDLPEGDHDVALDYRSDAWDHVGAAITLVALLAGAGGLAAVAARRQRTRRSSSSSRMSRSLSRTA